MTDHEDESVVHRILEALSAEAKVYDFRDYDGDDTDVPPFLDFSKLSREGWLIVGKKLLAAKTPDDLPHWMHTAYGASWPSLQAAIDAFHRSADPVKEGFADFAAESKIYAETEKYVTRELARVAGRAQIDAEKNAATLAAFDDAFVDRDGLELLPDPVSLIDGLIHEATYGMLIAPSRSFKSFVALDWACSVATGTSWLGREVAHGDVWYLVGEGALGVKKRVRAWEVHHGVRAERLTAFTRTFDLGIEESIPFQRFLERASEARPKLIVVDTLNRYAPGHDENSAAEMAIVVSNITKLVDATGAHVLLVHHTSKALDKTGRGSSSLFAAADASFFIDRPNGEGMTVTLETTKSKDDAGADPIPLRLDECEDSLIVAMGDAFEAAAEKAEADAAVLLAAIVAAPGNATSRYYSAPAKGKVDLRPAMLKNAKRLKAAQAHLLATGQIHRVDVDNGSVLWPGPAATDPHGFQPVPGASE